MDLLSTVSDDEMAFIAGLDYGQHVERHLAALRKVIFSQGGVPRRDQYWYPYEVIELGAHHLEPGHEREFAICTLLVVRAVVAGCDTSTDLSGKLAQHFSDYTGLPEDLCAAVFEAFALAGLH